MMNCKHNTMRDPQNSGRQEDEEQRLKLINPHSCILWVDLGSGGDEDLKF